MAMSVLTCDGCGGRNLYRVEPTEEEMTVTRLGPSTVRLRLPLPMMCMDCGSTANSLRRHAGG